MTLMAPVFAEARELRATDPTLMDCPIYVFCGNDKHGRLNPFQQWSSDDARTQLKGMAVAALGAKARLVFHCCRQSLCLRFAAEGGSTAELGVWGGWLGDDIKNYLKQGDAATMWLIAAKRRGWEARDKVVLPYKATVKGGSGLDPKFTGVRVLSDFFKRVIECFTDLDLDDNLCLGGEEGPNHELKSTFSSTTGSRKAHKFPIYHVSFSYTPASDLFSVFSKMMPPYDIAARRVRRQLPGDTEAKSPSDDFRVCRVPAAPGAEGEALQRRPTDSSAALDYAVAEFAGKLADAVDKGLEACGTSPRTRGKYSAAIVQQIKGPAGASAPSAPACVATALSSSGSGRLMIPALKDLIKGDWGNVGLVWDLWTGKHPDLPPLKDFRGGPDEVQWQWDPQNEKEHARQSAQFARIQAVVSELLCYIEDYDGDAVPVSDPEASDALPPAYAQVSQSDWRKRPKTLEAASAWAQEQMAQRWGTTFTVEAVYSAISRKQKKKLEGLSPWEQERNARRNKHQDINRAVAKARQAPGASGRGKATSAPRSSGPRVPLRPAAQDVRAALHLQGDADEEEGEEGEEGESEGRAVNPARSSALWHPRRGIRRPAGAAPAARNRKTRGGGRSRRARAPRSRLTAADFLAAGVDLGRGHTNNRRHCMSEEEEEEGEEKGAAPAARPDQKGAAPAARPDLRAGRHCMSEEEEEEGEEKGAAAAARPDQSAAPARPDPRAGKELEASRLREHQAKGTAPAGGTFPGKQDPGRAPRGFVNAAACSPLPIPRSSRKRHSGTQHGEEMNPHNLVLSPGMFDPERLAQEANDEKRRKK